VQKKIRATCIAAEKKDATWENNYEKEEGV